MLPLRHFALTPSISLLFLLVTGLAAKAKASDPCGPSALPKEIQTILARNYPDWQPEKLENLYEDDRRFWTDAHPADCPGIAIGHFESKNELSYALLSISKPDRKLPGLRILVFSRPAASAPYVPHVISKWNVGPFYENSDQVISTVPPGHYEEAQGPHKVQTDLDGILYEVLEKGTLQYYWTNGRYQELATSD
ncbi:MAG: hypothetical protein WCE50_07555 [Candidatus Acidiferrum sp.]